jgi:hypothetical protein
MTSRQRKQAGALAQYAASRCLEAKRTAPIRNFECLNRVVMNYSELKMRSATNLQTKRRYRATTALYKRQFADPTSVGD